MSTLAIALRNALSAWAGNCRLSAQWGDLISKFSTKEAGEPLASDAAQQETQRPETPFKIHEL